jgi:ABC-type hemin transport system ATPase subunit
MYCDRIYAVDRGAVVAEGNPEAVLTPSSSAACTAWTPRVPGRVDNLHITYRPSGGEGVKS